MRAGLVPCLTRLSRYALLLSKTSDVAEDLVQATCARAIERADQFAPGTRLDRWLFAILRSIWLNDMRARRVREGGGFVDAAEILTVDGAHEMEVNILTAEVLTVVRSGAGPPAIARTRSLQGQPLSARLHGMRRPLGERHTEQSADGQDGDHNPGFVDRLN